MFYWLSKLFWLVAQPSMACMMTIAIGLLIMRRWQALGRNLAIFGVLLLMAMSVSPLPNWLIYPLEQRFAGVPKPKPGDAIAGIIMLGGFEEGPLSRQRHTLTVNEAGERLFEGLLLARRFPDAKVIFTGGSFDPEERGGSEAVAEYLASSGIAPSRVVIEARSRTTYENAALLKLALQPKPGERFVLITSAFHMPRSVGVFRKQGYDVLPDAVDFRTVGVDSLTMPYAFPAEGLRNTEYALKEWAGLIAYWLSGRTSELWPGP